MIRSFVSRGTRDIFDGTDSRKARKTCPVRLWSTARRKLDQLNQAETITDLSAPPGNRLEALSGDREGRHGIRVNEQYRICFEWTDQGPEGVEIGDYHD
jgi:proteic killer suppression protein